MKYEFLDTYIDVYLKGHNGGNITTDRIGREGGTIHEPAVTIGLAIQPDLEGRIGLLSRTLLSRPNLEKLMRMTDLDLRRFDARVGHRLG